MILPHQCQEKHAQVTTGPSTLFVRTRKAMARDFHVLLQLRSKRLPLLLYRRLFACCLPASDVIETTLSLTVHTFVPVLKRPDPGSQKDLAKENGKRKAVRAPNSLV